MMIDIFGIEKLKIKQKNLDDGKVMLLQEKIFCNVIKLWWKIWQKSIDEGFDADSSIHFFRF